MRGHEPLIAQRKRGMHPAIVFVDLEPDRLKCWRDWHAVEGGKPTINVDPEESIARLDLRCIAGLLVSVHGNDEERVAEMVGACILAGASRVFSATCGEQDHHGAPQITAMTDTAGTTWRKS